jgi:hypothetical protein
VLVTIKITQPESYGVKAMGVRMKLLFRAHRRGAEGCGDLGFLAGDEIDACRPGPN